MLLAIDTSTTAIGAALHDGTRVLASVTHEDARRHGELLAPAIAEALERAGADRRALSAVVCGVGPGPFTGLRVGVVTGLVLAHALGLPAPDGVCSLDALAHELVGRHQGRALVATDARRKEVYWAVYDVQPGGARRLDGPAVSRAADLPDELRRLPAVGRGPELYPDALPHRLAGGRRDVDPAALADLAVALRAGRHPDSATGLLDPEPLYLRRPDAVAAPGTAMTASSEGRGAS
ncbi:tRNA (adenosine(37)-N6)-threonylcarbamoyltransferase complex dimerization subunit type 1 TsaB [Ornithinimicrobium avium]|uniref:tRNA (Adenosine(37)-N6)-threonylcarbamoyltransferase complex dimerization subunit type 1 TsaB n=1 Tax=Ornithinimicrobium avium TaxID=2283195 RepID=A0A345NRL9_9MICO|nr:tRNA (adenosine(37)-N6)-threonylcarbamoyltransferase complex dimerization subunit type 1 TsaB [Ornithinimicrobium avium]AXH97677.1 tRNA (adenosine(37)-N6)-threonylcarbamoyltransferase complex dimerization subunit type 1 TsaB [Ornithinimicrobium avium]